MMIEMECKKQYLDYIAVNMLMLISIIMFTETAMVCGDNHTAISLYSLVKYVPQAIIILVAPFMCYFTYFEDVPVKWKLIKLGALSAVFTISLFITIDLSVSILMELYGTVEVIIAIYPTIFFVNIVYTMLNIYLREKKKL